MKPFQVIDSLDTLTFAIELAVTRADWEDAVRAADARSMFVKSLPAEQPAEVRAAIRKMQQIDVRISNIARATLERILWERWTMRSSTLDGAMDS